MGDLTIQNISILSGKHKGAQPPASLSRFGGMLDGGLPFDQAVTALHEQAALPKFAASALAMIWRRCAYSGAGPAGLIT